MYMYVTNIEPTACSIVLFKVNIFRQATDNLEVLKVNNSNHAYKLDACVSVSVCACVCACVRLFSN